MPNTALTIGFLDLWERPVFLDTADLVVARPIDPLPEAHRNLGIVGCTINRTLAGPLYVRGSMAEALAAIFGPEQTEDRAGDTYSPTVTSTGAGVVTATGGFNAIRAGGRVYVIGRVTFTPAVPGTPETIRISTPPGMQPDAAFANATDATGVASGAADPADFETPVSAVPGGTLVAFTADQTAAGATEIGVVFSYAVG